MHEVGQRSDALRGIGRLDQGQRAADGAQALVQRQREGMRLGRQARPRQDQRRRAGGAQGIDHAAFERPRRVGPGRLDFGGLDLRHPVRGEPPQPGLDARRRQRDAIHRARAGTAGRGLDGEQGGAVGGGVERAGEGIGAEREHAARAIDVRQQRDRAAEGEARAILGGQVAPGRMHVPARAGMAGQQRGDQPAFGWRRDGAGEQAQRRARVRGASRAPGALERVPVGRRERRRGRRIRGGRTAQDRARALGIGEAAQRGLRLRVVCIRQQRVAGRRVHADGAREAVAHQGSGLWRDSRRGGRQRRVRVGEVGHGRVTGSRRNARRAGSRRGNPHAVK